MTLFIGPTFDNDENAYKTCAQRAREEKIVPFFVHDTTTESHLFTESSWFAVKHYFNTVLPEMRAKLKQMLDADPHADVHIDIGSDLGSIYAAYYVALERRKFSITVHNYQPSKEEVDQSWRHATGSPEPMPDKYMTEYWGQFLEELKGYWPVLKLGSGAALWADTHPLIIRKLMMIVLVRATSVFVTSQEAGYALMETFPRIEREYIGAPLDSTVTGSSEDASGLSSPA